MELKIKSRFWIETSQGPFLGFGRVELLEKIDELGSINKAALAMHMSYRQAWGLVESMNEKAQKTLVMKQTGGRGGGGAYVTEEGKHAIRMFKEVENDFQKFLKEASDKLTF